MASVFDYQFNVGGNFTAVMDEMDEMAETTERFMAVQQQLGRLMNGCMGSIKNL